MKRYLNKLPLINSGVNSANITISDILAAPYLLPSEAVPDLITGYNNYELGKFFYALEADDDTTENTAGNSSNSVNILAYIDNRKIHEIGNSEILFDALFDFVINNNTRVSEVNNTVQSLVGDGD